MLGHAVCHANFEDSNSDGLQKEVQLHELLNDLKSSVRPPGFERFKNSE
jgi:hypothetical protein